VYKKKYLSFINLFASSIEATFWDSPE